MAGAALASVALLSRAAVRTAFVHLERDERKTRLAELSTVLADASGLAPSEIDARLAHASASLGFRLLLVGADGRVRGASTPALRGARVQLLGERLEVDEVDDHDGLRGARKAVLLGAPRAPVTGLADGPAVLFALPALEPDGGIGSAFLATVNRWLLLSALGSGLLALVLTLALSHRIVSPLEALTRAAARMGCGDLSARVDALGRDEIGTLGRAFNAMAEDLARTEELRRTLVADVAHELRTPLTNLRCQVEALQDGLQEADAGTLRSLHEETMVLSRLVDDLQDLALAESGHLLLTPVRVEVGEAVAAAVAGLGARAKARGVGVVAELEPGLEVLADRERLGQVVRNLLANALSHTPSGGVVTVRASRQGSGVHLVVEDTGSGIAPAHLPHVFDRFYRADPARARDTGGAGLGLAIVKQLVAAHQGTVTAASEPGCGARFTVTLPQAPA